MEGLLISVDLGGKLDRFDANRQANIFSFDVQRQMIVQSFFAIISVYSLAAWLLKNHDKVNTSKTNTSELISLESVLKNR